MSATLTHSAADIVQQMLVDLGVATDPDLDPLQAWPVYASGEPATPDQCVTIYDTEGRQHGRLMTDGSIQEHLGFQVRVRSKDHSAGWLRADLIRATIAQDVYLRVVTVSAVSYLVQCVAMLGNILTLGKESPTSKRSLFTVNATLCVKQQ